MKLSVKDLINVGLFSVIYFIMFTISGILGYIPICVVILPLIAGILGGIPFVLFTIKEQKLGAVTLMGVIAGLFTFLVGQTWLSVVFGLVFGLLADLIMRSGQYKSWTKNMLGYSVFTLWTVGTMLPMWIMRETFFAGYRENGGTDTYINAVMKLTPNYMILVVIVLALVGGILGACLGKSVLKKHFEKAGIA
jgi:energy-coupling factor transport system substrate-specific component